MAYATGSGGTTAKDAGVAWARRQKPKAKASRRGRRLNKRKRRLA